MAGIDPSKRDSRTVYMQIMFVEIVGAEVKVP